MCLPSDFENYHFSNMRKRMLTEELEAWHKQYLPIKSGGTVLDIGAGEGETMIFYLLHGAQRLICVETDRNKVKRLRTNAKLAQKAFGAHIDVLDAMLDNIKIDIDGAEEGMVLEKHFAGRWKEIGHSKGFPAAAKVYKLVKSNHLDNLLMKKEQLFIKLLHPKSKINNQRN